MRTTPFRHSLIALGCLVFAGLVLPTHGQDVAQLGSAVRARMQAFIDEGEIAGAVTVVGRKDAILSYEAVGSQDLESRRPMAKDALFRIASMTKPITALGIMMLADEGKLSVDDPVEKHLPEFRGQMLARPIVSGGSGAATTSQPLPSGTTVLSLTDVSDLSVGLKKPSRPITLRDLLTHTSGLPSGFPVGLSDMYIKRNRTLAEGILVMSQQPLTFEPGAQWADCNAGIDTLGRIIEVASGQSYEDFLRDRIFRPLGMTDTTFYPTPAQLERLAMTYGKTGGKLAPTPNTIIAYAPGGSTRFPRAGCSRRGPTWQSCTR